MKTSYEIIIFVCVLSTSLASYCHAQQDTTKNLSYYLRGARKAYDTHDTVRFVEHCKQAVTLAPKNPAAIYNMACADALIGEKQEALTLIKGIADMGLDFNMDDEPDFQSLRGTEEYKNIRTKIEKRRIPISHSEVAFTIHQKDLIPENIAYDPITETFYAGSLYLCKIISIAKDGTFSDFTTEKQDGLWSVIGMKVDAKRRILWAASSWEVRMKGFNEDERGLTGIFKYDLTSRKLIKKYLLPNKPQHHLFNDLVLNAAGDVYISDTQAGEVYLIDHRKDILELFGKPGAFPGANGVALLSDEKHLFVAHDEGVSVIDLSATADAQLKRPETTTMLGIDGMYFYKNSLITIQTGAHRVARYYLNSTLDRVDSSFIIESYNPLFDQPTTGVVVGNTFYYIANSQYDSFSPDGTIFPVEKRHDVIIMKTQL